MARFEQAGAVLVLPPGQSPGLAIGLGGLGAKLADLVMLYAGIADLGTVPPLRERLDTPVGEPQRLLSPVAAWYVSDVLRGSPPPENGVAGRIAFKTGTSYGYRDAWSVGFDGKHTIGVWVGRPDGAPVPGLIGREARRADTVRRLFPIGHSRRIAARAYRRPYSLQRPIAAAVAALPVRAAGRRQWASVAAHSVPARRRAPRSRHNGRQARSDPAQIDRRGRAAHGVRQWRPTAAATAWNFVLYARVGRVLRG